MPVWYLCGLATDHAFLKQSFYLKQTIWLDPVSTSFSSVPVTKKIRKSILQKKNGVLIQYVTTLF
jgi:hypothetical protein